MREMIRYGDVLRSTQHIGRRFGARCAPLAGRRAGGGDDFALVAYVGCVGCGNPR